MSISLSNTVLGLSESATLKMAKLARKVKAEGHDVISLSLGEPDFKTPEFIIEAAKQALDNGYTFYTPVNGHLELREAIVTKFSRDNGLHYQPDQIVVSNGAKQSIYNLCQALINHGDEVILFTPYWVSYFEIVRLAGGVPVELTSTVQNDYKVSPEQLMNAISDKTKMVLFSSPCNPTGTVYTKSELKEFADILSYHPNVVIVSDEIYEYIVFEGDHHSIAQFDHVFDQTVVVNGMSKGFSMTGWRLGYMAAPLHIAKACTKIQGQVTSGATSFGQKAAAVALASDLSECKKMTKSFKNRRDLMISKLKEIPYFKINKPNGAFYLFPDISQCFGKNYKGIKITDSTILAETILNHVYVGVVAGAAFGNNNSIRISYAISEERLMEAARRLHTFFSDLT